MSAQGSPASSRPLARVLGAAAQAVGAIGVVIGAVLGVVVLLGRGRVVNRLDEIVGKIDAGIAQGIPLLASVRERAGRISGLLGDVGAAARARAAEPGPAPERVQALLGKASELSDKYLSMRATYADARERVGSVLGRLDAIDDVLPAVSLPQGPAEALAALDKRVRALDADVMEVIEAVPDAGAGEVAGRIAGRIAAIGPVLQALSEGLDDAGARLDGLRARVAARADGIRSILTLASIALIVGLLYLSMLHGVLYGSGRRWRRGAGGP